MTDPRKKQVEINFTEALKILAKELCSFLEDKLEDIYGTEWWNNGVIQKLDTPQEKEKFNSGYWQKLEDLDFMALLKLTRSNFTKLRLKQGGKTILAETIQVRHRHKGHDPTKGIKLFDYRQDVGTLIKFSDLIDISKQNKQFIQALLKMVEDLYNEEVGVVSKKGYKTKQLEGKIDDTNIGKPIIELNLRDEYEELTNSQENAIEKIQVFLNDQKSQCFVLNGYAGTGKTFLIGGIVDYLSKLKKNSVIMAPTGRAARVLSENHKLYATTIHKGIYFLDKLKEYKESGSADTYKLYFDLLHNDNDQGSVFIIDESSLLSDVYSENEFIRFGSGKLLSDLFQFIGFDQNDNLKKVIFVGDNAQLPPVDMSISPALVKDYIKNYFNISVLSATLTDVKRQEKNNKVLENATNLRQLITEGLHLDFDFIVDNENTFEIKNHDIVDIYKEYETDNIDPELMVIVHSNSKADSINKEIRNYLYPNQTVIAVGDRVMVVKNNYNYDIELMNGQIGKVIDLAPYPETKEIPLNVGVNSEEEKQNEKIKIVFRKTTLLFRDVQKKEHTIECMIVENLLYSKQRSLSSNESKALYVDFLIRHPKLNRKSEIFKEELLSDMYFNALQIKFAYAVTCHKAQGGEWPNVIADFSGQNKLRSHSLRWCYTAMTRAQSKLYAINPMYHSMLTPLKQYGKKMPKKEGIPLDQEPTASFKEEVLNHEDLSTLITEKLKHYLADTQKVEVLLRRDYHIKYAITEDEQSCRISVYYNSKNQITKNSFNKGDEELYKKIKLILDSLNGFMMEINSSNKEDDNNYDLSFFRGQEPLLDFHNGVIESLTEKSIQLINVKFCTKYQLVYRVKSANGEVGTVNYYFDKNGVLTKIKYEGDTNLDIFKKLTEIHHIE